MRFRMSDFDCAKIITQLGVGEALVSTLGEKAVPSVVERTLIRPPSSRIGPITDAERRKVMDESPVSGQYDEAVDRESAFEMLQKKAGEAADAAAEGKDAESGKSSGGSMWGEVGNILVGSGGGKRQSVAEAAAKSVVRSVGSSLGRALVRGILGSLTKR